MKKGFINLSVMFCSVIAINHAMASEIDPKRLYLQSNLGISMGGYPGKDFEQNSFSTSGVYGLAVGYKFNDHFRADFGVDYRGNLKHKWTHQKNDMTDTQETKVNSWTAMVTGYFDIVEINKFTPYVFAGVGIARNVAESKGIIQGSGYLDANYSWSKNPVTNFAWKIGAGTSYKINKQFDLGVAYQYINLGIFGHGNIRYEDTGTKNYIVVEEKGKGKLAANEILINLKYKF